MEVLRIEIDALSFVSQSVHPADTEHPSRLCSTALFLDIGMFHPKAKGKRKECFAKGSENPLGRTLKVGARQIEFSYEKRCSYNNRRPQKKIPLVTRYHATHTEQQLAVCVSVSNSCPDGQTVNASQSQNNM